MGKQRGFKPGGVLNPIAMSRKIIPSGPSAIEKLQRQSRPTWEDIRVLAKKKEMSSSEFLAKWEQEHFQEQLTTYREMKRTEQEKRHLKELRREAKRKSKLTQKQTEAESQADDSESDQRKKRKRDDGGSSSDESEREPKRKKKKSKKRKRRSSGDHEEKVGGPAHPHKLSSFFKSVRKP